jgi:large subunit ribosomal protein L6e
MVHAPRNKTLAGGISRYSRSAMYAKKALYKKKKVTVAKKDAAPAAVTKTVEVKGAKNGKTRTVQVKKLPKYYPADDVPQPKKSRKSPKPTKLRSNITPGTVLILLAGRFRGKRVVFLKQLPSGLLLVTGPYKINGVPLRRVNQAYVISTSTKVDLSKVAVSDKLDDSVFKKPESTKEKKPTEEGLFGKKKAEKSPINPVRAAEQKALDKSLLAEIKKVPQLKAYLNASFSLSKGELPHLLKF